ncbi:MAG: hypothetical protein QM778_34615 [Myxococcales bacterium]
MEFGWRFAARAVVMCSLAALGACSGDGGHGGGSKDMDADVPGGDASLTDGGGGVPLVSCQSDLQCPANQPHCAMPRNVCVQCLGHGDCGGSTPYCDSASGSCVECVGDGNCGGNRPYCSLATHVCGECSADAQCTGGRACVDGMCDCPGSTETCNGQCVDRSTDEANCGRCGHQCDQGEQCVGGVCHPPCQSSGDCSAPLPYCDPAGKLCVECLGDANCVGSQRGAHCDPTTLSCVQCVENADCAALGAGSLQCVDGRCGCPQGQEACGAGGACVNTATDANHCGSCGNSCNGPFETGCANGECTCAPGLTACGGGCRDLAHDPDHCGTSCGNAQQCSGSEMCEQGACVCRPGLMRCGDRCVDPSSNPQNCGACAPAAGSQCAMGDACQAGACTNSDCADPTPDTCTVNDRRSCTNFDSDPLNCGKCGGRCDRNELCVEGECRQYASATTCNSCPCQAVCSALLDGTSTCCTAQGYGTACVEGGNCPAP